MDTANWPSIIYLLLLLFFIGGSVFSARGRQIGTTFRQIAIWAVIFAVTIGGVAWYEKNSQTSYAVSDTSSVIELRKRFDGHFHLDAVINGVTVPFIVDTGASQIVLTQEDAERVGLDLRRLDFNMRAQTANGTVATAPVLLETMEVEGLRDTNVRAVVNGGDMTGSLLGMSYLSRFDSIEIQGERLILRR